MAHVDGSFHPRLKALPISVMGRPPSDPLRLSPASFIDEETGER
jgi:hypothetical protein